MARTVRRKLAFLGLGVTSFAALLAFQNFTNGPAADPDVYMKTEDLDDLADDDDPNVAATSANTEIPPLASMARGIASIPDAYIMNKKGAGISGSQERNILQPEETKNYPAIEIAEAYAQQAYAKVKALNAKWYYTWSTRPLSKGTGEIEFIPMLFTAPKPGDARDAALPSNVSSLVKQKSHLSHILLYNEPDHEDQGDLEPKEAAEALLSSKDALTPLTSSLVSPVQAGSADKKTGVLPWLDKFYLELKSRTSSSSEPPNIGTIAYHHYIDPVKLGYVPTNADPERADDPFYSNPANVDRAAKRMASDFLNRLLAAYRRYQRPIWITEFGVVDRGAESEKGEACRPPTLLGTTRNRVSQKLVAKFLEIVLPELQINAHIARFAIFSNSDAHKELNRTSAVFKSKLVSRNGVAYCDTSELTELVGAYYASFQPKDLCQRGEFKSSENQMTEWVRQECGRPRGPGWSFDEASKQYRRILSFEEAKAFQPIGECKRWRYYNRQTDRLDEGMTAACVARGIYKAEESRGWRKKLNPDTGALVYKRTANMDKEKVSIFVPHMRWR